MNEYSDKKNNKMPFSNNLRMLDADIILIWIFAVVRPIYAMKLCRREFLPLYSFHS